MRPTLLALFTLALAALAGCKKPAAEDGKGTDTDKPGTVAIQNEPVKPKSAPGKWSSLTVGKSTTFLTGPVDASGHIDYVTALNDLLSKGVSPENNANVAIWRVIGPNPPGGAKFPPGFFERLGMPAPPAVGDYFLGLQTYCEQHAPNQAQSALEAMGKLSNRPWTASENAVIAGWIQANEKPLTALRGAVQRSQYYNPLLPEQREKGFGSTQHPGLAGCRELAGALLDRAMLRLGGGDVAEAWQDILACYRLGRQVGRGGTLIEGIVAIAIEQLACRAEVAYLDHAKLDAKTIEGCLRDLFSLPKSRTAAEQIELAERIWFLDTVMQFAQHSEAQPSLYDADFKLIKHGLTPDLLKDIDWNAALEVGNAGFDQLTAIFREKDRATRVRKLAQLAAETHPDYARLVGGNGAAVLQSAGSATECGRRFGQMLFASEISLLGKVNDAYDRIREHFDTVVVGFALVWYQRVNGRYSAKLADLVPTYLKQVPKDIFTGNDLIYRPDATGFLLYSVGVNGRDDGGRSSTDQPQGDDLVVRIPQPARP